MGAVNNHATPSGKDDASLPEMPLAPHERVLEALAVIFIGALCLTICISILSRAAGRSIIPDEVQWVELMMIVIITGPLAVTFAKRMSIGVEVFTAWATGRALRILAVLGHVTGLGFLSFLLWAVWRLLANAWQTGEYYKGVVDIPNWIGAALFLFCLAVAWGRLALMIVLDLKTEK